MTNDPNATPPAAAVAAHIQQQTHKYFIHYPAHLPRETDPHYAHFNEVHRRQGPTAVCLIGAKIGFDAECTRGGRNPVAQLELHHKFVEFSLQNEVDIAAIMQDWPALTDQEAVDNWVESDANLEWLCAYHHRGSGGAHTAAYADFVAEQYVRNLISSS